MCYQGMKFGGYFDTLVALDFDATITHEQQLAAITTKMTKLCLKLRSMVHCNRMFMLTSL